MSSDIWMLKSPGRRDRNLAFWLFSATSLLLHSSLSPFRFSSFITSLLSTPHILVLFITFFLPCSVCLCLFLPSLSSFFSPPPLSLFPLSGCHKSLSCWLLKCEEWQIWWFLTAVAGVPRFTSPHCLLWSRLSDLTAKYTRHEYGYKYLHCFDECLIYLAK